MALYRVVTQRRLKTYLETFQIVLLERKTRLTAASSRIEDTDLVEAMLLQANQQAGEILNLLK